MYYSELVKKACVIMYDAHRDDVDKSGYPYVFHPFYLAAQMDDEESVCAALLHDVIEDCGVTEDTLRARFGEKDFHGDEVLSVKGLGKRFGGRVTWDELGLPCTQSGMALPCGATGRWTAE